MTWIRHRLTIRRRRQRAGERAVREMDIIGFESARAALGRAALRNSGTSLGA